MSTIKMITILNWVLITTYGVFVCWALLQPANPANDAGGSSMETALKGLGILGLLILIGLNWQSAAWTKVVALLLVGLLLGLVRYIATH